MEKLFEKAMRKHLRFKTSQGNLPVEDLWDLPLQSLDTIYKNLKKTQKASEEESLLGAKTTADKDIEDAIEIVKYIVEVKLDEINARKVAADKAAKRKLILNRMVELQQEEFKSKTFEDLQKELLELEG